MDELVKMSENKEFLVMDVVAACVNLITSSKKRADLRSISRALWNVYEMNESSCETLLDALVLERKILKIKGKTEYFFENARNFNDFTLRIIEGDGIVTTHAEKCLAGVEGDKLHYDDFEKFLLETGEFKDTEEVKFGLLEDIIDKKVELENEGEEDFWAPKTEVGNDGNDDKLITEEILPSETEKIHQDFSESENLLEIPPSVLDKLEETSTSITNYSEELVTSRLEESTEMLLSGSLNSKETQQEEVPPSRLEEEITHSEKLEEISKMSIKSSDVTSTSVETSLISKLSESPELSPNSAEPSSDLGFEDYESESSQCSKKRKVSESEVPKIIELNFEMKTDSFASIKKEKCEDSLDEPLEVEAKSVDVKPEPHVANLKIKEEPASDDEIQNSSRASRSSRQRLRGYSDLPPKKSSRVSSKKFDDDYYFPSLKRKTITRRKKTGSPEPIEVKKEPSMKKIRPQCRPNAGMKCPICKTICKANDIPVRCLVCNVSGHPACVEQEQMLYLNVDQFDLMNWTCEDCRISTPGRPVPKAAHDGSTTKLIDNSSKMNCDGTDQLPKNASPESSESSQCSPTKEGEDKKCAPDRVGMRSDMVVIHGLKSTTPVNLIWNEIAKRGFQPTKVVNALSKNKDPLDMFFVVIPNLASDSKIYSISRLFNRDVKILRPFQLKRKNSDVGRLNEPDYDVAGENEPDLLTLPSSITIEKRKKKVPKIKDNDLCNYAPKLEIAGEPEPAPDVYVEILEIPNENELVESNVEDNNSEVVKSISNSPQRPEIMETDSSSNIPVLSVEDTPSKATQEDRTIVLIPGRREWKFPPRWVNRLNRPVPDPEVPDCIAWTTEQVADYFATYFNDEVSKKFIEHDIDGYALKLLTRGNVLVEFGLNLGLALRVLFHVKRLQIRTNDRSLIYMDES